ncbi:unnamed protein product [Schistosoma turkestanicum]|nr:unnamed protein product [Schistosoma turkestanicum]
MSVNKSFEEKCRNILPYVNGAFIEPEKKEIMNTTQVGSLDLSVFSCQSAYQEAIKLAESFEYDSKSLESFLKKLVNSLEIQMPVLLDCLFASLEFESTDFFSEVIREILKKMKQFIQFPLIDEQCFYYPNHVVEKDDCDFIFHFTFILRYLCYPVYRGKSHGLIVTCKSPRLMAPLTMLTHIIHESTPPNKLFNFLPIFNKNTESYCHSRNITMVYQSSDIDSATRYCVSSLRNAFGTGIGHSPIILVEESIYKRFIKRIENLLNLHTTISKLENDKKSEYPSFCNKYIHELITYTDSIGARILCHDQKIPYSPIFVHDITPSSVKFNRNTGPVAYIVCFRTVKESISLLTYFINYLNNHKLDEANSMNYETIINLWQTDSNIIWQLYQMLLLSGVDNIFINASSRQLAATMYTRLFEINGLSYFVNKLTKMNNNIGTLYKTLSTIMSTARTAQINSISKGYELIQSELLKGEPITSVPIEKEAYKLFMNYSRKLLGGSGSLFLTSKRQDTLLIPVAHICLKPAGPIVLVIDCQLLSNLKNCTYILKLVFCILFAGNAIVLIMINNELNNEKNKFLDDINKIQKRLSMPSLITIHQCSSSSSSSCGHITELDSILPNLCEPSTIVNLNCEDILTKDLLNEICLCKPVTLYWSTGCNVFS